MPSLGRSIWVKQSPYITSLVVYHRLLIGASGGWPRHEGTADVALCVLLLILPLPFAMEADKSVDLEKRRLFGSWRATGDVLPPPLYSAGKSHSKAERRPESWRALAVMTGITGSSNPVIYFLASCPILARLTVCAYADEVEDRKLQMDRELSCLVLRTSSSSFMLWHVFRF